MFTFVYELNFCFGNIQFLKIMLGLILLKAFTRGYVQKFNFMLTLTFYLEP